MIIFILVGIVILALILIVFLATRRTTVPPIIQPTPPPEPMARYRANLDREAEKLQEDVIRLREIYYAQKTVEALRKSQEDLSNKIFS